MATVISQTVKISSLELSSGDCTVDIEVDCCLWGQLDQPLVVLMGGISASRWVMDSEQHQGWWNHVVGDKGFLNTRDYCFLTFEYFSFEDKAITHPLVTTTDQAQILQRIQQQLNLPQFHVVIGSSYGGMVALAFAAAYPNALQQLICIAAADTNSVKSQALRHIQRQILTLGATHTTDASSEKNFLALARSLAMVCYRGKDEWADRFQQKQPGESLKAVAGYLDHLGTRFAENFSASRYCQLSQSIDYHQVDVDNIQAKTALIGITSDQLVPVEYLQNLRRKINSVCQLHLINSIYGHDGFLLEADALNQIFKTFLKEQTHDYIERNSRRASGY